MRKIIYYLCVLSFFALNACDNNEITDSLNEDNQEEIAQAIDYSLENGRLKLSSVNDLRYLEENEINIEFQNLYKSKLNEIRLKSGGVNIQYSDSLVPDPVFAMYLNSEREIQVGDTIFRITPNGTYFCVSDKYENMLTYALDTARNENKTKRALEMDRLERLEDGVYRYDTFAEEYGSRSSYSYYSGSSSVKDPDFSKFKKCKYSAKTWAGKALESIFGRNKWETERFSSKRKVEVKFYNYNYFGLFQSMGIKVRFRKKNWVGWSDTRCEELRLGFEGVIYQDKYADTKFDWNRPENMYSLPLLHSVGVVEFNSANHDHYCITYYDKPGYNGDWTLEQSLKRAQDRALKALQKQGGRFPYSGYGDKPVAIVLDENKKQTLFIGEITHKFKNVKEATIHIATKYDGKIVLSKDLLNQSNLTDGWDGKFDMGDNFDLKKLSVYGCAKYDNKWKGIKLVLD